MLLRFFILGILFLVIGCKVKDKESDTLSGELNIISDESFLSLIDAEVKIFKYQYKDASISSISLPESEAIKQFVEGKADMAVVSRELTQAEKAALEKKSIAPQSYIIGSDGIALIVNKERNDSSLLLSQLKEILNGKLLQWEDIGSKEAGEIIIAFDLNQSSNLLFINKLFPLNTDKIKVFAAGSNAKVLDYVKQYKNAIGIISVSAFSDNPVSNQHLKDIKVLSVEGKDGKLYLPWQDDLATGKYPLKREIIVINKYKEGLGTGFVSFVLGDDGQRIILKSGLLPVKIPGREVILNK